MNILQCGYGVIGKKLYPEFMHMAETTNGEIVIYDPPLQKGSEMTDYEIECRIEKHYDAAFICVPTKSKENGECDVICSFRYSGQGKRGYYGKIHA